jgi:CubicO group peptidase (beta-lactamase class C family)
MILDPLGMNMTFYFPDDVMITHRFAVGHHLEGKKAVVSRPWAIGRAGAPVGGVVSTVKDLLTYARFHMGDGRSASGQKILKANSLKQMRKPLLPATGFDQIGLTWFIREAGGIKIVNHGGATNGQIAGLYFVPERQFALAVLTNSEDGRAITGLALKEALKTFLDVDLPVPEPIQTPAEDLVEFVGKYEMPLLAYELKLKKGKLLLLEIPRGGFPKPDSPPLPVPPPMHAAFYEKDKLVVLDDPMKNALGEFLRQPDGTIQYLRLSSRVLRKIA